MAQPGSIGSMMPASEDTQLRKLRDLERSVTELAPSIAKSFQTTADSLNATIAELSTQTAYQAGLITRGGNSADYALDPIPGDQVIRYFNSALSITMPVPTGRVLVTVGSGSTTVAPGNSAAEAWVTFNITREGEAGVWWANGIRSARLHAELGNRIGTAITTTEVVTCGPGTRTFNLSFATWSASATTAASALISTPFIVVQVIDAV